MKKEKKGRVVFLAFAMVFIMFGLGYVAGRIAGSLTKGVKFEELFHIAHRTGAIVFSAIQGIVVIGGLLVSFILYQRSKVSAEKWDGEDEDYIDSVERLLTIPISISSTVLILNTVLFSCAVYFAFGLSGKYGIVPTLIFLVGMALILILNEKCVQLVKKLNPEKQGSAFDINFQKKWMDSCDEGQKQIIWQAGYSAYKAGNMACFIMWIFSLLAQVVLPWGLIPVITVGVIWLSINTAYILTAAKLERH